MAGPIWMFTGSWYYIRAWWRWTRNISMKISGTSPVIWVATIPVVAARPRADQECGEAHHRSGRSRTAGTGESTVGLRRGTADRAWASMGSGNRRQARGLSDRRERERHRHGRRPRHLVGQGKGTVLQVAKTSGNYVALAPVNEPRMLSQLHVGDSVQVDNSDFLASADLLPSSGSIGRLLRVESVPRQQRSTDLSGNVRCCWGHCSHMGAAGCIPDGNMKGKMILCSSLWDRVICLAGRLVSQPREETFGRRKCRKQFPSVVHRPLPCMAMPTTHAVGFLSDHHLSGIARHQRRVEKASSPLETTDYRVVTDKSCSAKMPNRVAACSPWLVPPSMASSAPTWKRAKKSPCTLWWKHP